MSDESVGSRYVLDTFAYVAYELGEPEGPRVRTILQACSRGETDLHMCAVNVTEVAYSLRRRVGDERAATPFLRLFSSGITIHDATLDLCLAAADLKRPGISLGDAFAAALARKLDATLLTGDPEFKRLKDLVRIEWLK